MVPQYKREVVSASIGASNIAIATKFRDRANPTASRRSLRGRHPRKPTATIRREGGYRAARSGQVADLNATQSPD
jgi:hypothetical protein